MFVDAGELNRRIKIFRRVIEADSSGYGEPKLVEVLSCWARVTQVSGRELIRSNADFGETNIRFLIRWPRTAIDRKMIVRYHGGDLEIVYLNGYGDSKEYLEILCTWTGRGGGP